MLRRMETARFASVSLAAFRRQGGPAPRVGAPLALLKPSHTPGGYRLYSADDEARVDRCKPTSRRGFGRRGSATGPRGAGGSAWNGVPADLAGALWSALDAFDDAGAQAAFDRLVATFSIEAVASTAILPYLRTLGDRWRDGDASVAQEHFATGLLRARLLGLARGWDRGAGPRALLACPSGERHDLGSSSSASRCVIAAGA